MKNIIEYKDGTRSYDIGDVVFLYFNRKKGKPTCRAIVIMENKGSWFFKPLSKQSVFFTRDGLIPFGCKPYISAKQVEAEEAQP